VLLRHDREREPHRQLSRHRQGEIPQREYFGAWRSFPDSCDWSWQETRPVGFQRSYFGERVFDGAYRYNDTRVTRPGAAACSRR
jgi:hypothetical protein